VVYTENPGMKWDLEHFANLVTHRCIYNSSFCDVTLQTTYNLMASGGYTKTASVQATLPKFQE